MSIATSALTRPRRGRLYIVIGAVLAVLAFATAAGIASLPLIQGTTTGIRVVVASHDIQARTVIQASDLTLASISPTPPQSFTAINKVTGMGARVDIPAGMPISSNLVAPSGDLVSSSDVAYLPIPRGWVAVTVPTSEQAGVGVYGLPGPADPTRRQVPERVVGERRRTERRRRPLALHDPLTGEHRDHPGRGRRGHRGGPRRLRHRPRSARGEPRRVGPGVVSHA